MRAPAQPLSASREGAPRSLLTRGADAVQQWEYRVEILGGTPQHMQPQLGRLGLEGWELVAVTVQGGWDRGALAPIGVFKRPLAQGAAPYGWQPG